MNADSKNAIIRVLFNDVIEGMGYGILILVRLNSIFHMFYMSLRRGFQLLHLNDLSNKHLNEPAFWEYDVKPRWHVWSEECFKQVIFQLSRFRPNLNKCEIAGIGVLENVNVALCGMKNINLTKGTYLML